MSTGGTNRGHEVHAKMNVIILDEHQPEDGRLARHITYLLRHTGDVFRLHFSLFAPTLKPGRFSLYGEKGYRIKPPFSTMRLANVLCFNTMYLFPSLFSPRIQKALEALDVDPAAPTVLHVHDPGLLRVAMMMKRDHLRDAQIVYDRHEFFEVFYKKTRLPVPTIHRMYEILARDSIDGVVHASLGGNSGLGSLFPRAASTQVPNYPLADIYDEACIQEKARSFGSDSSMNLLYIGSLNPHDRDIGLLLKVASEVLGQIPKTTCFIGGPSYGNDAELERMMLPLQEQYGERFRFHQGYVARDTTQRLTERSHVGFLFVKPETTYWITSSPNKLFESLRCGAIPVVRASVESSEEISGCSLLFDRYTPEEEIVTKTRELLSDPERCRGMMEHALSISPNFTFEAVGPRYLTLYTQLLNDRPPVR
ncbi:hypothetical protein ABH15_06445 [Methanoculleus taiwanensis]|uniref:Glycosyl transferase family 1 domain-containing protein n=2 Tax=Methanoculleus taiwanensis TaxID=1550565 RepID=A0A498H1V6_9EURY|nr:hypothetical protein ABH15_06445 [Methanoculleus taiwanensis]